ncbi:MAG: hypothetical protein KA732_18240 [Providencia sp.]|uniref:hypothetical protein n=1 Tax=Providencia sp. TaxID=589 RepID=UPI001B6A8207|nr:hypothetical protein [Providencia sp.]MBP6083204.1 hypothetical protein [Providencia sp.]
MKNICVFLFPISFLLTGCDSAIQHVKDMSPQGFSQYTYQQLLDHRDICQSIAWTTENTDHQQVIYTCELKKGKNYFNYSEEAEQALYKKIYEQEAQFLQHQAQSMRENVNDNLNQLNADVKQLEKLQQYSGNLFAIKSLSLIEQQVLQDAFSSYYQQNKNRPEIQRIVSTLPNRHIPPNSTIHNLTIINFDHYQHYQELYLYFHHPEVKTRIQEMLDMAKSRMSSHCISAELDKQKAIYKEKVRNDTVFIDAKKAQYIKREKEACERTSERYIRFDPNYLKTCESRISFPEYQYVDSESANRYQHDIETLRDNATMHCEKPIIEKWQAFDSTLTTMSDAMLSLKNTEVERETTALKQEMQKYQEKLNSLAPEKQNKVIDAQAKLAAENAVKYYLQQYPDKGVERIVWEYNKGTNSYFLKEKQLIEKTKEGEIISTQPLDMSQLIAGSLSNIDIVDDYMAMGDPFRLPPISVQ